MFYNKKWIFLIILYAMSSVLYYFITKQLILTGLMSGFLAGSLVVFALIAAVCFLIAMTLFFLVKISYMVIRGIFKIPSKETLAKTFWTIFTVLCYAAVFVVFFKMIEY
ncbi:MAG: hypothetical protein FWD54_04070 [Endomicrobia bacterium]|nr:hypothetical protein [Endomicrobiia bacterium]MCL2799432.1 hypothetical protein [Endomicrobiia bacterium]